MANYIPSYIKQYDFNEKSYQSFVDTPISSNQLDEFNNLILSSNIDEENIESVEKFLMKVEPRKNTFNSTQVENFFDTTITEFQDSAQASDNALENLLISEFADEVDEEVGEQLANEKILQTQVDEISDTLDKEIQKSVKLKEDASETYQAAKDLIISQRISVGEGKTESDFSNKFPFLPLSESEEDTGDSFPFMNPPS